MEMSHLAVEMEMSHLAVEYHKIRNLTHKLHEHNIRH